MHADFDFSPDSPRSTSLDPRRLVEEVKERLNLEMQNEDVFLATTFFEFSQAVVLKSRGGSAGREVAYDAVVLNVNNMEVKFPKQLFIDGQFVNAEGGRTIATINPADESVICEVSGSQGWSAWEVGSAATGVHGVAYRPGGTAAVLLPLVHYFCYEME